MSEQTRRLVHYAPTGSDAHGDGTIRKPFRTREEALFWANEGDELCDDGFVSNSMPLAVEESVTARRKVAVWIGLATAGWAAVIPLGTLAWRNPAAFAFVLGSAVIIWACAGPGSKATEPRPGFRQNGWGKP